MPRRLYSMLLYLALPCIVLRLLWRGWRDPANRGNLREHLALDVPARADAPLWLHAASVGELRAVAALLHALDTSGTPVVISVGTPTGCARARQLFAAAGHEVRTAPWDLPGATQRFMTALRPRALVIVETELWPNLIATAALRGVPMALVSARLSERSLVRYLRLAPALMRDTVCAFGVIGAQSDADRTRLLALGAVAARVRVIGNLKFDMPVDETLPARGAALRQRWAGARALWVAGSTHAGEEQALLEAQRRLLASARARGQPAPLLAFAPRRPERFAAVARWVEGQGLQVLCTTAHRAADTGAQHLSPDVVLIDEMGVLPDWYAAADVAFVGGTLVPVGGHNLLEPAALARPVLCGPHTFNAPEVTRHLVEAGGARVVRDADELFTRLSSWLAEPAAAAAAGAQAASAVAANRGSARRACELLRELGWSAPSATG